MSETAPLTRDIAGEYERLRRPVLDGLAGRLRGQNILYDARDLEDFYNEAWQTLYLKHAAGEAVGSAEGFLAQVAYFRAIDDVRRRHPGRVVADADVERAAVDPDLDARLDDEADLVRLLEGMRAGLSVRERQAAVLCYLQGLSRPEAAEILGLPERRMQKLMDGVSRKLAPILEAIRSSRWCEEQSSLVQAYAMGLLDPAGERYALAVGHLDSCSACRRRVLGLRGIAALMPPTLMPWHLVGGGGASSSAPAPGPRSVARVNPSMAGTAAVAAAAAVAAGVFALTRGGGDDGTPQLPSRTPAPVVAAGVTTAPSATASAAPSPARPARRRRAKRRRAPAASPSSSPSPVPTPSPAATITAAPPPPSPSPAATPQLDAGQEFGLQP